MKEQLLKIKELIECVNPVSLLDRAALTKAADYIDEQIESLSVEPKDLHPWCPDVCPITARPFFMWIEHPDMGVVPTYGGPFDSYTIPEPDNLPEGKEKMEWFDIEFSCARYDHDEGCWRDYEDPCMRIITDEKLVELDAWPEFSDPAVEPKAESVERNKNVMQILRENIVDTEINRAVSDLRITQMLEQVYDDIASELNTLPSVKSVTIELGNGDKIVTDIYDDIDSEWSGIAISEGDCPVGEFADIDAKTVDDLNPIVAIRTANPASLDVIIAACERAKQHLINSNILKFWADKVNE